MDFRPDMDAHLAAKKRQYAQQKRRARIILITLLCITIAAIWALIIAVAVRLANDTELPELPELPVITTAPAVTAPPVTEPPVTVATAPPDTVPVTLDRTMVTRGSLILVSALLDRAYDFSESDRFVPLYGNKTNSYRISSTALSVHPDTLAALNEMFDAYKAETGNRDYQITQASRTLEEQQAIYDSYHVTYGAEQGALLAAKPGYSEHHAGYALDMNVYTSAGVSYSLGTASQENPIYGWIYDNAAAYGFVQRYPEGKTAVTGITNEPWHFRYVGKGHAAYMVEHDLVLEEYVAALYGYSQADPLTFSYGDVDYTVFFVPLDAETETVELFLPKEAVYTLSGDNADGVFVTLAQ